ncbi:MAG: hypothetical protein A2340_11960 [Lentisphaerae bacterium RIFOXYB12_FULL_60_10]|nr:MAG: hypothetical protein A2340_11960 [Lentisphaerae bacterium RIFOXYB12_FULL_60_10]
MVAGGGLLPTWERKGNGVDKPAGKMMRRVVLTGMVSGLVAVVGVAAMGLWMAGSARQPDRAGMPGPYDAYVSGSGQAPALDFGLSSTNARRMVGVPDAENERWADIAGNFYSAEFVRRFDYADTGPDGPCVWVSIRPVGPTLMGRIEAHRLKPNFAYQLKLQGDYTDREAFERIGYLGRWRLPGRLTNYQDEDYRYHPDKSKVEAYLLFDYFVTDARGQAVHEFVLSRSLHVLWNVVRQNVTLRDAGILRRYELVADDAAVYMRPKTPRTVEYLYAEPEFSREQMRGTIRLPAGRYTGHLVLTEESFHGYGRDNGYWATPLRVPVEFHVTGEPVQRP